jgi:MiaB/RimO family radical SAM methylthiotransferase
VANPFVSVVNLGCRVNRVESDRISLDLDRAGFVLVDPDDADLIVINTCAVTGEAEAKTRKAVRHALARPRKPLVIATGCSVNLHPEMVQELSDRVYVEPSKVNVCARACVLLGYSYDSSSDDRGENLPALLGRTRLGVKVQDGCNNRCTYCIVWKARGPERSVPLEAVLELVNEAVRSEVPEIVLTGVNLGAYDGVSETDSHVEIDELVRTILERTDIPHIRLSSVEPMDVNENLLRVMAEYPDRVAPFLHLPIQSGSTSVLERMGRPYTAADFEETVSMIRRYVPSISLSCDVIVGFPGESESEFRETYELCQRVGFSRMHVFRYSARPGTPAAEAPDQVDPEVMAERSRELRELATNMRLEDAKARLGSWEIGVVEGKNQVTLGSFHHAVADGDLGDVTICRFSLDFIDEHGMLHVSKVDANGSELWHG